MSKQIKAISAVEQALARNSRTALLAMGTGKNRTVIGLMYRFLKAERFKRIFVSGRQDRAWPAGHRCVQ